MNVKKFKLLKIIDNLHGNIDLQRTLFLEENEERIKVHLKPKEEPDYYRIQRFKLKQHIMALLDITDSHTVNSWVMKILARGAIFPNPTTQLSTHKRQIRPTNDTFYFIYEHRVNQMRDGLLSDMHEDYLKKENEKTKPTPTLCKNRLDKYFKPVMVSKGQNDKTQLTSDKVKQSLTD